MRERLQLRDVRAMFRLIGDIRAMGSDPAAWRTHLIRKVRKLFDAAIVVSSEIHVRQICGQPVEGKLRVIDVGWGCESNDEIWQIHTDVEARPQEFMLSLLPDRQGCGATQTDSDVPVLPAISLRGGSAFVLSQYPLPHLGAVDQLGVHKDSTQEPFSAAQHRLIHLFHVELGRPVAKRCAAEGARSAQRIAATAGANSRRVASRMQREAGVAPTRDQQAHRSQLREGIAPAIWRQQPWRTAGEDAPAKRWFSASIQRSVRNVNLTTSKGFKGSEGRGYGRGRLVPHPLISYDYDPMNPTDAHPAPNKNDATERKVIIRIRRQDGPEQGSRWEEFAVPHRPQMNIISCLQWIAAHPTTTAGVETTTPVWDSGCLEEVCGACTMLINGKARQACSALVDRLGEPSEPITLEPMSKFPLVRDLFVDRRRLFDDLKRVKAWVPIDGTYDLGEGPPISHELNETRYPLSRCISCGCCLEACPQYTPANAFVGAAVINQARLFNDHPIGSALKGERLDALMEEGGVADCGKAGNCVEVCPKEIPLLESIATVQRQATLHVIKKFFSR